MTQRYLLRLFAYTEWANHLVLGACAPAPKVSLLKDFGSGHHSVFETLLHMFGAERIWFERWRGAPLQPFPTPEDYHTIEELADDWRAMELERHEWLVEQTDDALKVPLTYKNLRGEEFTQPFVDLAMHVVNHATHHRGQVVAFLRTLGVQPPNTDLVHYFRSVE